MPFVFVDGEADQEQIDKVLSLLNPVFRDITVEEIITINEMVSEKKRMTSVRIPIDMKMIEKKAENKWEGNKEKEGDVVFDMNKLKKAFKTKYNKEPTKDEFILFVMRRLRTSTIPSIDI